MSDEATTDSSIVAEAASVVGAPAPVPSLHQLEDKPLATAASQQDCRKEVKSKDEVVDLALPIPDKQQQPASTGEARFQQARHTAALRDTADYPACAAQTNHTQYSCAHGILTRARYLCVL